VTGKPRGRPREPLLRSQLVYSLQNHDQVGNRPAGERLNHVVSERGYASAAMLLLFLPSVPMLFMGQEWAATSPFCYFTDHEPDLGRAVTEGRRREFAHFAGFGGDREVPDPQAESTFLRSKLDWSERNRAGHARVLSLYQTLLSLRRTDPVLERGAPDDVAVEAEGELLRVERWLGKERRWLFVNFGRTPAHLGTALDNKHVVLASSDDAFRGSVLGTASAVLLASGRKAAGS
jgi:maltooligosyltrehalose trehalohydrolase